MARNSYIYGLAREIYVAETDSKGGTWEGAMDGLRRHRTVYVRIPEPGETNANRKLIDLGAVPVSMDGVVMNLGGESSVELFEQTRSHDAKDPEAGYDNAARDYEKEIFEFLKHGAYTSKEIRLALKIDWDARKLTAFLRKNQNVKILPGKPVKFTRNDVVAGKLF
jgi:predicted Rossmann fold nucleotide-binding protein DprA/Smf involved in DNA uptake